MSELLNDNLIQTKVITLHQYNGQQRNIKAEVSMERQSDILEKQSDNWSVCLQSARVSLGSNQLAYCTMGPEHWLEVEYTQKPVTNELDEYTPEVGQYIAEEKTFVGQRTDVSVVEIEDLGDSKVTVTLEHALSNTDRLYAAMNWIGSVDSWGVERHVNQNLSLIRDVFYLLDDNGISLAAIKGHAEGTRHIMLQHNPTVAVNSLWMARHGDQEEALGQSTLSREEGWEATWTDDQALGAVVQFRLDADAPEFGYEFFDFADEDDSLILVQARVLLSAYDETDLPDNDFMKELLLSFTSDGDLLPDPFNTVNEPEANPVSRDGASNYSLNPPMVIFKNGDRMEPVFLHVDARKPDWEWVNSDATYAYFDKRMFIHSRISTYGCAVHLDGYSTRRWLRGTRLIPFSRTHSSLAIGCNVIKNQTYNGNAQLDAAWTTIHDAMVANLGNYRVYDGHMDVFQENHAWPTYKVLIQPKGRIQFYTPNELLEYYNVASALEDGTHFGELYSLMINAGGGFEVQTFSNYVPMENIPDNLLKTEANEDGQYLLGQKALHDFSFRVSDSLADFFGWSTEQVPVATYRAWTETRSNEKLIKLQAVNLQQQAILQYDSKVLPTNVNRADFCFEFNNMSPFSRIKGVPSVERNGKYIGLVISSRDLMFQQEMMSAEVKEKALISLTMPMSYTSSSSIPGYQISGASNQLAGDVYFSAVSRLWAPLTSSLSLRRFQIHCSLLTREGKLEEVEIAPRGVFSVKLIFAQVRK